MMMMMKVVVMIITYYTHLKGQLIKGADKYTVRRRTRFIEFFNQKKKSYVR